jgi:toxin ParE1/3/4
LANPSKMKSSRRLVFAVDAENDLEVLLAYSLATWSVGQRDAYAERLLDAARDLQTHPRLGRARDDLRPGLRVRLTGQHAICYVADDDTVRIVRILHSKMDPTRHIRPPQ